MTHAGPPSTLQVRPGVGLCLTDGGGRILLHRRRDSGRWAPPSGGVEAGESLSEAALREAAEETGLSIRIDRLIGVYSSPDFQILERPEGGVHYVTTVLACSVEGGELAGSEEGLAWSFFDGDRLPSRLTLYARAWLEDWRNGAGPYLR